MILLDLILAVGKSVYVAVDTLVYSYVHIKLFSTGWHLIALQMLQL